MTPSPRCHAVATAGRFCPTAPDLATALSLSCATALLLGLVTAPAWAADDEDALAIADRVDNRPPRMARDWQLSFEAALARVQLRDSGDSSTVKRGTLDLRVDRAPAAGWRLVLADQLDLDDPATAGRGKAVNSLKEAYVSWQPQPDRGFEFGRVNVRSGVALGYNPTDWFRDGALRGYAEIEPQRLRSNRLGTLIARGQTLWDGGALAALVAPKLATQPSQAAFDPDFALTNDRQRALLTVSQRWGARLNQQALVYAEQGRAAQLGLNSSALLSDATTAFVEWAGGRDRSVLSRATGGVDDTRWRTRLAVGATYTTSGKLSFTAEYHRNGAGLGADEWRALALDSPAGYGAVRNWAAKAQEMPTRSAWFVHATWQDWPVANLDVTALARVNREDNSRLTWLEARWHGNDRMDIALQWQALSGRAGSEYGALPQSRRSTVVARVWF